MHTSHAIVYLLVAYVLVYLIRRKRQRARLPPSPKGWPILGNIFDVPKEYQWLTFQKMSQEYNSDIIYLNMLGNPMFVLNSFEAVSDLLERRSANYSDRPVFTMLNELVGLSHTFAFMRYGAEWKERRKMFHKEFQPPAVLLHRPAETLAARRFLKLLLDRSSTHFLRHLRHMAAMITMPTVYGIDIKTNTETEDEHVVVAEKALEGMAATGVWGTYLVDIIPWLKYLPDFLPGTRFQAEAREWRKAASAMPESPFQFVKRSMASGKYTPSITSRLLDEIALEYGEQGNEEAEWRLKEVMAQIYVGGTDTTVSALGTFVLGMVLNPETQKKAQKAVDNVIGSARLPEFSDFSSIPLVDAILKESLRWKAVLPLSAPHATLQDDVYRDYDIPAGSIVVGNTGVILQDESLFGPNTDQFNPERFLTAEGELNPDMMHPTVAFGFGRRQCPGIHVAESSMWITIASVLACFDIVKTLDQEGVAIEPDTEYSSGVLSYPPTFECTFRPRNDRVRSLIEAGIAELGEM